MSVTSFHDVDLLLQTRICELAAKGLDVRIVPSLRDVGHVVRFSVLSEKRKMEYAMAFQALTLRHPSAVWSELSDFLKSAEQALSAPLPTIGGTCRAYQASDQMICGCGRQWDVNDPDPPECPLTGSPAPESGGTGDAG